MIPESGPFNPEEIEVENNQAISDWFRSAHADAAAEAFRHWDEDDPQAVPAGCAKCHSEGGYLDFLGMDGTEAGVVDNDAAIGTVACDVTDEASVEAACAAAGEAGPLRIVVANAGTGSAGPFHTTTLDDWNSVLGTNLTGAFLTMKHAVPQLAANGGGSIVAISSIAAASPLPMPGSFMRPSMPSFSRMAISFSSSLSRSRLAFLTRLAC